MPTDPTAIAQDLFDRLAKGWNNADGAAFGEPFAAETDFVDIRGTHHHGGAAAMGAGHQAIFDTIYAGSTIAYRVESARTLPGGCILAHATATLDAPGGPLKGITRSVITAVLVDNGGKWECTAFHNTVIAEPAA